MARPITGQQLGGANNLLEVRKWLKRLEACWRGSLWMKNRHWWPIYWSPSSRQCATEKAEKCCISQIFIKTFGIQRTRPAWSAAVLSDILRHTGVRVPCVNGTKILYCSVFNNTQHYCLQITCLLYYFLPRKISFEGRSVILETAKNEFLSMIHPVEGGADCGLYRLRTIVINAINWSVQKQSKAAAVLKVPSEKLQEICLSLTATGYCNALLL